MKLPSLGVSGTTHHENDDLLCWLLKVERLGSWVELLRQCTFLKLLNKRDEVWLMLQESILVGCSHKHIADELL